MDMISKETKNENLRQQLAVCKEFIACGMRNNKLRIGWS